MSEVGDFFAVTFAFAFCVFFILGACEAQDNVELGQMICDEQYGEGQSKFQMYGDGYVTCKSEITAPFDGGYTKLVGGD